MVNVVRGGVRANHQLSAGLRAPSRIQKGACGREDSLNMKMGQTISHSESNALVKRSNMKASIMNPQHRRIIA